MKSKSRLESIACFIYIKNRRQRNTYFILWGRIYLFDRNIGPVTITTMIYRIKQFSDALQSGYRFFVKNISIACIWQYFWRARAHHVTHIHIYETRFYNIQLSINFWNIVEDTANRTMWLQNELTNRQWNNFRKEKSLPDDSVLN